jgi:hypothetical protein
VRACLPVSGHVPAEPAGELRDMPVWAFLGAQDTRVELDKTRRALDEARAQAGDTILTVDPEGRHDAAFWDSVYGRRTRLTS